ncbi:hypothetical protein K2173_014864 [Erythroxylum novogranatense]|uniref:Uncharacterized protein n=1 Tax=Erythroxylum novogranatense TaxID=1862640 RepID=A0AAV8TFT2_9ROSI|nr:hypothetical protein K2173_014864 [Erythroxylum novogranatense]
MAIKMHEEMQRKQAFRRAARDNSGVLSPFKFSGRATREKRCYIQSAAQWDMPLRTAGQEA